MNIEQTIKGMTKAQRDYVGVFGNQWAPRKTVPFLGTCQLCVWGSGYHDMECRVRLDSLRVSEFNSGSWPHSSGE